MKELLPSKKDAKILFLTGLVLFIAFGSLVFIRNEFVDPVADAAYAQINGTEEE